MAEHAGTVALSQFPTPLRNGTCIVLHRLTSFFNNLKPHPNIKPPSMAPHNPHLSIKPTTHPFQNTNLISKDLQSPHQPRPFSSIHFTFSRQAYLFKAYPPSNLKLSAASRNNAISCDAAQGSRRDLISLIRIPVSPTLSSLLEQTLL